MQRMWASRIFLVLVSCASLWAAHVALADNAAVVQYLKVSPSFVQSGDDVVLSWLGTGSATAVDLYFACPAGVTLSVGGTAFPCNTAQPLTPNLWDSGTTTVTNLSATQQYVYVTAFPKDSNGNDSAAGAKSTFFLVGASTQPIKSLTFSASTTQSDTPVALTWTSSDPLGVNIEISCNQGVQVVTASGTAPCNTPAFPSDLPESGSTTVSFINRNASLPVDVSVSVVPEMGGMVYNAQNAHSETITVMPSSWQPIATVTSFSSASSSIVSGEPFSVAWATANAAGANIEFMCPAHPVTLFTVSGTTTSQVSCGTPIFAQALDAMGSTTLEAMQDSSITALTLELVPQTRTGTYLGTSGKTLTLPFGSSRVTPTAVSYQPVTNTTSAATPSHAAYTFTQQLQLGSSGADVTALQQFLANDPSVYPSGLVTGYYGAMTVTAVELFQEKYGIASPGSAGFGSVGPKTRAELNALQ